MPSTTMRAPESNAAVALVLSLQQPDARHRRVLARARVRRWVQRALERDAELTLRIVEVDEALALNRDYRGKAYATNVLTFDYAREPRVVADIVLCAAVVEAEARAQGKELADHYAHLVVHGVLHAQGWDHERADDARRMEAREVEVLAGLGVGDPYRVAPAAIRRP
jgi:probable rRNA maturation factor